MFFIFIIRDAVVKKLLKSYRFWTATILLCAVGYVFIPWVWFYFGNWLGKHLRGAEGVESPNRYYYTKVAGLTYINGNFLLFITKPYMFRPADTYIYASSDGQKWDEVAMFRWYFGSLSGGGIDDISYLDYTPQQLNNACYYFDMGIVSANCRDNWKDLNTDFFKNLYVWFHHKFTNKPHGLACDTPLKHKNSLVKVYSNQPPKVLDYDIKDTTQLVPNYAVLYQTFDGVNWHKLEATESVMSSLITENYLKPDILIDRYNNYRHPNLDFDKLIPVAYDIPCYTQNNRKAWDTLNNIIVNNNISISLESGLVAYGDGKYIGIFKNLQGHYSFISSIDGKNYTISLVPTNVLYSLAGSIYKTY